MEKGEDGLDLRPSFKWASWSALVPGRIRLFRVDSGLMCAVAHSPSGMKAQPYLQRRRPERSAITMCSYWFRSALAILVLLGSLPRLRWGCRTYTAHCTRPVFLQKGGSQNQHQQSWIHICPSSKLSLIYDQRKGAVKAPFRVEDPKQTNDQSGFRAICLRASTISSRNFLSHWP
jgi:hypothetical protein